MMRIDEVVLLVLKYASNEKGQVEGRTLLQKLLYFVNEVRELGLNFSPYYYGPYSFEVTLALEEMKSVGIIKEEVERYSDLWLNQFEPRLFKYTISDFGNSLAEVVEKGNKEDARFIKETVRKIKDASKNDYKTLSIAAKMFHILKLQRKPLRPSEIIEEAKSIKWVIKKEEAKAAVKYLKKIELVK